jgi:hypothetical protein
MDIVAMVAILTPVKAKELKGNEQIATALKFKGYYAGTRSISESSQGAVQKITDVKSLGLAESGMFLNIAKK